MSPVEELAEALAHGAVRVVDLSQSLSEDTIVIELPPPFAQSAPSLCSRETAPGQRLPP